LDSISGHLRKRRLDDTRDDDADGLSRGCVWRPDHRGSIGLGNMHRDRAGYWNAPPRCRLSTVGSRPLASGC